MDVVSEQEPRSPSILEIVDESGSGPDHELLLLRRVEIDGVLKVVAKKEEGKAEIARRKAKETLAIMTAYEERKPYEVNGRFLKATKVGEHPDGAGRRWLQVVEDCKTKGIAPSLRTMRKRVDTVLNFFQLNPIPNEGEINLETLHVLRPVIQISLNLIPKVYAAKDKMNEHRQTAKAEKESRIEKGRSSLEGETPSKRRKTSEVNVDGDASVHDDQDSEEEVVSPQRRQSLSRMQEGRSSSANENSLLKQSLKRMSQAMEESARAQKDISAAMLKMSETLSEYKSVVDLVKDVVEMQKVFITEQSKARSGHAQGLSSNEPQPERRVEREKQQLPAETSKSSELDAIRSILKETVELQRAFYTSAPRPTI
uniref:Uncharacterized protein n=1 Tax=Palpitomonas bilix TaxID=652834 RepID=A0A7S3G7R5_9EUKA|mmetsp:Transcript_33060/g.85136  ORF Transcript_33060/g.85136 Transcript_33060/m.85136 type:complete len:370 (+) Transcript_33060:2-1111(+)